MTVTQRLTDDNIVEPRFPTCAVVMATYNGEEFIREQLDSIRLQSHIPDKVIIRDDRSTDKTASLVEAYIAEYRLANWDFRVNGENKGFVNNFLDGALESTTDIVFFSDQDDIWAKNKIQSALSVFTEHDDALAVACDVSIIDKDGKEKQSLQIISRRQKAPVAKVSFESQVSSMLSSGLTLAVKRDFLGSVAMLIKERGLTYDSPIGLLAAARGGFYRIGDSQVLHRVHSGNISQPTYTVIGRLNNKKQHLKGRQMQYELLVKCADEARKTISVSQAAVLNREIESRAASIKAMEAGELVPLILGITRRSPMKNTKVELMNLFVSLVGRD